MKFVPSIAKYTRPLIMSKISGHQYSQQPNQYNLALVTCPNQNEADKIAHEVVADNLAACVNIVPTVKSVYKWEGKVHSDSECLLVIKTRTEHNNLLLDKIKSIHSYQVPEFITIPITGGSEPYIKWLSDNTNQDGTNTNSEN
ncbi:hypothetical protein MP228_009764 [Amoeboaphelidium protococcarum]|nr:hypothetical protein MP228_009764 [Amoeboaphelidium protococcarum]